MTTTALDALLPIARDAGLLEGPFGTHLLVVSAAGEFGPIVAIALLLTDRDPLRTSLVLVVFAVAAVVAAVLAARPLPGRLRHLMTHTLHTSGQLPVCFAVVVVALLVWLAESQGLDILLGAFSAGLIVRLRSHTPGNVGPCSAIPSNFSCRTRNSGAGAVSRRAAVPSTHCLGADGVDCVATSGRRH